MQKLKSIKNSAAEFWSDFVDGGLSWAWNRWVNEVEALHEARHD